MAETPVRASSEQAPVPTSARPASVPREILIGGAAALAVLVIALLFIDTRDPAVISPFGASRVIVLAIPVFLAGVLSFLSPCTLPILPAYFAFTFQANRQNILLTTVAFFLGLATTTVLLGATATALGALLFQRIGDRALIDLLTLAGGLLIIAFGIMSLLGKGFAGLQVMQRPSASMLGSYVYGATFALGWTTCVGPLLGSVFGLLATQGLAVAQGAVLAFVYTLGLGLPLIIVSAFFSRMGAGSPVWRFLKGWGRSVQVGPWTLHVHSTSIISGVLLITMGLLLATGQLTRLTQLSASSDLALWLLELEDQIIRLFGLGR